MFDCTRSYMLRPVEPLDLLLTAFSIAWLAAFQWALLSWLLAQTGK